MTFWTLLTQHCWPKNHLLLRSLLAYMQQIQLIVHESETFSLKIMLVSLSLSLSLSISPVVLCSRSLSCHCPCDPEMRSLYALSSLFLSFFSNLLSQCLFILYSCPSLLFLPHICSSFQGFHLRAKCFHLIQCAQPLIASSRWCCASPFLIGHAPRGLSWRHHRTVQIPPSRWRTLILDSQWTDRFVCVSVTGMFLISLNSGRSKLRITAGVFFSVMLQLIRFIMCHNFP